MGATLSVDESVRVVIVGGGFGGTAAATHLKSWGVPFLLVDMRDSFHHNVGALRASVETGFARKTFIPYANTFPENFKQGKLIGINLEKQQVLLESGEELYFSHLILATGSDGPFPGKFNQTVSMELAIQTYENLAKEVEKAGSIVVIGGGAAGVEMAAEVKTDYPDKEVSGGYDKLMSRTYPAWYYWDNDCQKGHRPKLEVCGKQWTCVRKTRSPFIRPEDDHINTIRF